MNQLTHKNEENKVSTQFFILFGYTILGLLLSTLLAILLNTVYYGFNYLRFFSTEMMNEKYIDGIKITQIVTSIGIFFTGPFFLARKQKSDIFSFYQIKKINFEILGIALLIFMVSMPAMEYIAAVNQKMHLPVFLKSLESWMQRQENQASHLTILLLKINTPIDFLINIIMIALIPAIVEELMFRGALQHILGRVLKNKHLVIWLTAIIFSAIHMQFYGFLPRMMLGAGFGYLFYWSGNIGYAMIAHFMNNAFAVCMAWYMQKNNVPLTKLDSTTYFFGYQYAISFILTLLLFYYFKNKTKNNAPKLD